MIRNKYIGDKKFYRLALLIAVPIMVQNGITNFVNLLDNIMVGRTGTEQMSGVSIVNQLFFVYNLCIFGGFSGAGIFTAQYFGKDDINGVRTTTRIKVILGAVLTIAAFIVFYAFGDKLIELYLHKGSEGNLELTLTYALDYLKITIWGLPLYMLVQVYASTLRECGETVIPMKAGIVAVAVNFVFNWILIFGKLGFPAMGVRGAAIATVLSRIAEAFIVVFFATKRKAEFRFAEGLYTTFRIPSDILKKVIIVGSPLLINEALWSMGQATLLQCYSTRGLESVAGFNISSTVINVFKVVFLAMGNTVGILVGRLLGAGKIEEAVDTDRKLITFSVLICCVIGPFLALVSFVFPLLYNTSNGAKLIARNAIMTGALFMPLDAFKNSTYYTIRSGGKTVITFLLDAGFTWIVSVPIAFFLSRFTTLTSVQIFICVNLGELLKGLIGYILVKKRVWICNMVQ